MALTPDILLSCVRYNLPNSELLVTGQTHDWASEGLLCLREWQLAQFLYLSLGTHSPDLVFTLAVARLGQPCLTPA